MRKRKKPYVLVAIVIVLLSIVGYVNLKTTFSQGPAPEEGNPAEQPATAEPTGSGSKDEMKAALVKTMSGGQTAKKPFAAPEAPTAMPNQPAVTSPDRPPMKPVPSDTQTGRLTDNPNARK